MDDHPLLEARALTLRHGDTVVLDALSAAFAPGELVGVIGARGAGKTSLLDLLAGRVAPSAGELFAGGRRLGGTRPTPRGTPGIARAAAAGPDDIEQALRAARRGRRPPRLLLLDGAAGVAAVAPLVRRLRDELDMTVIWTERAPTPLLHHVERVLVLHRGRKIADGTPAEVLRNAEVAEAGLAGAMACAA